MTPAEMRTLAKAYREMTSSVSEPLGVHLAIYWERSAEIQERLDAIEQELEAMGASEPFVMGTRKQALGSKPPAGTA